MAEIWIKTKSKLIINRILITKKKIDDKIDKIEICQHLQHLQSTWHMKIIVLVAFIIQIYFLFFSQLLCLNNRILLSHVLNTVKLYLFGHTCNGTLIIIIDKFLNLEWLCQFDNTYFFCKWISLVWILNFLWWFWIDISGFRVGRLLYRTPSYIASAISVWIGWIQNPNRQLEGFWDSEWFMLKKLNINQIKQIECWIMKPNIVGLSLHSCLIIFTENLHQLLLSIV